MFRLKIKKKTNILTAYKELKDEEYDFERISSYFTSKEKTANLQNISAHTWSDLDLDEIFMFIDRTSSRVGQQYLYSVIRTIPEDKKRADRFESILDFFNKNPDIKKAIIPALHRLSDRPAYFLKSLFLGQHIQKPRWFWIVPILSTLSIITTLLCSKFPVLLLLLLLLLCTNSLLHYWNKNNVMQYSNAIPQLLILNQVAKQIHHFDIPVSNKQELAIAAKSIDSIGRKAFFFKVEAEMNSDLAELVYFLTETLKALFLVEPLMLFGILEELENKREDVSNLFCAVGETDTAISIESLRDTVPYFSIPEITESRKYIYGSKIFHPLIVDPVANSIEISDGKSVLISGSNMSGKTTFIRTVGINAILSQTINTAFAEKFILPRIKIHSAIRISDNLLESKSYFLEEVNVMKELIRDSRSSVPNLFILDELFKGTNTLERVSLGKAVLSYLNRDNNLVFVSSHDIELADHLSASFSLFHFSEKVEGGTLSFDYLLKEGRLRKTNAINILEINEYPNEIITEARAMVEQLANKTP